MKIKEFFLSENEIDLSLEYALERYRNWRAVELSQTDWTQLPDAPVDSNLWATYRQDLRDLPATKNFLDIELPLRP